MKKEQKAGTVRLRWRALDINEWRAIPKEKRETFERSKGKKTPPVRGADIPGRYFLDSYEAGNRHAKNLDLRTTYDPHDNDETERLARQVVLNFGDSEWREKHHFEVKGKGLVPFSEYFDSLVEGKHWAWMGTKRLLDKFPLKETPIGDIDYEWLSKIQKYFLNAPTRSQRNLSQNSASTYYAKIKAALQIATQRGLIKSNPATNIKAIPSVPSQRVYLTIEEIQLLANTPCKDEEVKRAFLFSCYTGLRISDIIALTWDKVRNGRLAIRVQKTKVPDWIDLHPVALELVGTPGKIDEPVFNLPPDGTVWTVLQIWAATAGLTKHISFHVSRHTFGTLMLGTTNDIYLVSKLMGHSSVTHTMAYAKIVDSRKKNAMLSLPGIDIP